ncbi:MAG: S8 family serine peptidase [Brumimicrobium sp.]
MIRIALLSFIIFVTSYSFFAQQLYLKSGTYDINSLKAIDIKDSDGKDNFKLLVFESLPDSELKEDLKNAGITLLDYLPKNTYYAKIDNPTKNISTDRFKISHVINNEPRFKLSKSLKNKKYPEWAIHEGLKIDIVAQYFSLINVSKVRKELETENITILDSSISQNTFTVRVSINNLDDLFQLNSFQYFEPIPPVGKPENLHGRTEHRSNTLWTNSQNGLKYRGEGVNVMMQDDGTIGPHIDFSGRIDQSECSPCYTDEDHDHGDHVAGTIMGAGNIDPKTRGMAHGAELFVYNSSNNNYDLVPDLYNNQEVYITSKSYSNGCNAGYTNLTQELDQQVHNLPSLIHVFSSGNDGNSDCGYGAGAGWGNITGGHKAGKNLIAVGNLTSTSTLANSSSRGPAEDGRIKPDICGVGSSVYSTIHGNSYGTKTGTSMSCPGVSGTIAQLYDAFSDLNNGSIPAAGLIKGTILNTADDIGNPGPDFKHGWGSINARRAFEVLNDSTYITDDISNGDVNTHTIDVPANIAQLRVMVYWTDYEGSTTAAFALVNDLNMEVTDPNTILYQPWVLDHTPNVSSLDADAIQGVDSLNNMEQVTIDNPTAGQYEVSIEGLSVPQGPQTYHVIYYFEKDEIEVTYPLGGEGLKPGSNEVIRWDAPEGTDPFTVSFSDDDGATWNPIATVGSDVRHYAWNIPTGTFTGLGRIRVERNANVGISEEVFTIINTATNLGIEWSCPDSLMLSWDPVDDAISYEISALGSKYMDSIASTSDTSIVLQYPSTTDTWFSVKAYGQDNAIGERAIAIHKTPGEHGCTWSAPYAGFDIDCESAGELYCFTLYDESINTDNMTDITWYFPGGTPSVSNAVSPQVCYDAPGDYDVAMVVDNGFGIDSVYQPNYIDVVPTSPITYYESFEDYTTFNNNPYWESLSLNGGNAAFEITTDAALTGDNSAVLRNHGQPSESIDELISGPIDLSVLQSTEDVTLSFRYSYRKRSEVNDEWLRVFISQDCNQPWALRKTLKGNALSELESSNYWIPTDEEDWVTVHMTNITSSYYTEDFRMKFQFESDGGNNFYLEDINMYKGEPSDDIVLGLSEMNEVLGFTVFPNPADESLNVRFDQLNDAQTSVILTDISGKKVLEHTLKAQSGTNLVVLDTEGVSPGMYMIHLTQGNNTQTKKVIVQ